MARWLSAAIFSNVESGGAALRRLRLSFTGHEDLLVAYLFVAPAPLGRDGRWRDDEGQVLCLAAIARYDTRFVREIAGSVEGVLMGHGGRPIELPPLIVDCLFQDWSQRVLELDAEPNLLFLSTLDKAPPQPDPQEDPLVVTSHAKCRRCGQARHKTARFNLCQVCWEKLKPEIRREWRTIKERRHARRTSLDLHVNEALRQQRQADAEARERAEAAQRRQELAAAATVTEAPQASVWDLTPEQAQAEIDAIRASGVPGKHDPAKGRYMQLFKVARGLPRSGYTKDRAKSEPSHLDQLLGKLYIDTDIPVHEIARGMHVAKSVIGYTRNKLGLPARDAVPRWHPRGRILEGEELTTIDGEPVFRDSTTGAVRPIWPPAAPEPQEEPVAMPDQATDPEPTTEAATTRRARKTFQEKLEIAQAYDDVNIPLAEIRSAFNVNDQAVIRYAHEFDVPIRRKGGGAQLDRPKGRILNVNGKWTWKSYDEVPEEASQEAPVEPATPSTNGHHVAEPERQAPAQTVLLPQHDASWQGPRGGLLAVAQAPAIEHAWYVRFSVPQSGIIGAASFDDVARKLREQFGPEVQIEMVQRA